MCIRDRLSDRPYRFIIFVDDLSFEEHEIEYKYLKAVLEGSLEPAPENVLIYATSNRRHLIREYHSDRAENEVKAQDTLQEKLSLSDRFGITVVYLSPDQEEYLNIVEGIAESKGIDIEPEQLRKMALKWELWHNRRSGRTAKQFIEDLLDVYKRQVQAKQTLIAQPSEVPPTPVSYTHLDVYKRQGRWCTSCTARCIAG